MHDGSGCPRTVGSGARSDHGDQNGGTPRAAGDDCRQVDYDLFISKCSPGRLFVWIVERFEGVGVPKQH